VTATGTDNPTARHNKKADYTFVDGHVEAELVGFVKVVDQNGYFSNLDPTRTQ
jgi:prepilin-type processing-associated H-X9-DG protein